MHRDIKPSNILRSTSGEIKITDLGLALQSTFEDERVTREGTTVGTVDYMAPEQARDSRAASLQSDMYSLGCTFYYLLTGIPPFPGGDIIDKLTRHAKSPPPNVRDLRPDLPEELGRVMVRMMAKRPDDRYATFDELIQTLAGIPRDADSDTPAVALAPLDERDRGSGDTDLAQSEYIRQRADAARPPSSIPEISLANLPPELAEPESLFVASPARGSNGATLPQNRGHTATQPGIDEPVAIAGVGPSGVAWSARAWVTLCVTIGCVFLISVITIDRLVRLSPSDRSRPPDALSEQTVAAEELELPSPMTAAGAADRAARPSLEPADSRPPPPRPEAVVDAPPVWTEPRDAPPAPVSPAYPEDTRRTYLPDWALASIPERIEGPLVQVRRVTPAREAGMTLTLRMALDETRGTVEIADNGPLWINDLRIPGETRLVRGRDGFRPLIRIDRPALDVVRNLPGVFSLEGRTLILDSLDLIVNLRDLPPAQSCLFHCVGASLTLRNCSITLINPGNLPFTLVRAEGTATRGARIRIEKSLIRGAIGSGFELGRGSAEVAVVESVLLGSQGPIVRSQGLDRTTDHRFAIIGGVLACRGPAFDLRSSGVGEGSNPRPFAVRAFDTVFGRFQGAGIASVMASDQLSAAPRDRVDWLGQQNVYCGWKGFYASGPDQSVRLPSLASLRSTWNPTDLISQEIPVAWPQPHNLAEAAPSLVSPFVPGREGALERVPVPGPFQMAKTLGTFPQVTVPFPIVMDRSSAPESSNGSPVDSRFGDPRRGGPRLAKNLFLNSRTDRGPRLEPGGATDGELLFDTEVAPWHGDLGAFLRDKLTARNQHLRVRVVGAGPQRSGPVRLPDGTVLEVRVEPPATAGTDWLSWAPEPEAGGRALFELHGGTLLFSGIRLRAAENASVESLIHVEDGDLILHQSQLIAPPGAERKTRCLVSFTAAGTGPRLRPPTPGVFTIEPDRPVCIIGDSTLVTGGIGLRAEVGRGLVALTQSAMAAGATAIELVPGRVARGRFDADLVLDHCTLASESTLIDLWPWPGSVGGPERPWLISSTGCAFLGTYDRRTSDTVLLRVDEEAMAQGTVFWQGTNDAIEVDGFAASGPEPPVNRAKDVLIQWVNFWGSNHMREITGRRAGSNLPSVRLLDRPKPGRVEPADLVLDPDYHPGRKQLDVGADLARQGVFPRAPAGGRRR